jgi:hypothetical protein
MIGQSIQVQVLQNAECGGRTSGVSTETDDPRTTRDCFIIPAQESAAKNNQALWKTHPLLESSGLAFRQVCSSSCEDY